MILGRYLLTILGLNLNCTENIITIGKETYEGCSSFMVDVINYAFKTLSHKRVKPEEYFINTYFNKYLAYEGAISSMCRMCKIMDAKYKKADLNKSMAKQCQYLSTKYPEDSL